MTDLTDSLRLMAKHHEKERFAQSLEWRAADEIERLRAVITTLRRFVQSHENHDDSAGLALSMIDGALGE